MKKILFFLVTFIALTSIVSGLMMIGEPDGSLLRLPIALLDGTPFTDYFFPGIILTVLVGFVHLLALYYLFRKHPACYLFSMAGGFMIVGWIIIQMILISVVHWLHIVYLIAGFLVILISLQARGKWMV